jgi:hypothetical protein
MPALNVVLLFLCATCLGCSKSAPDKKDEPVHDKSRVSESPKPGLNPKFSVVEGNYEMSKDWSITLPGAFNRRLEDKNLVLWRPGITAWVTVWGNDKNQSRDDRLKIFRDVISADSFAHEESRGAAALRFGYRLNEKRPEGIVYAFYGFAFADKGHVQIAIYFDQEDDIDLARRLWQSLKENR